MSRKIKNKKDTSTKVPQKEKMSGELSIIERDDLTEKQKKLIDLVMDKETKIVFIKGPAGTSKSFISIYCGLKLLNAKKVSDLIYIRTVVESGSRGIGSLPGDINDKFGPYMMPLEDKLDELLPKAEVQKLKKDERIQAIPINFMRGASLNAKFICCDESQNFTFEELTTAITRYGKFSKMIICGDAEQSDIGSRSGFPAFFNIFDTEKHKAAGIHTFEFNEDDIVRSELLKLICKTIRDGKDLRK